MGRVNRNESWFQGVVGIRHVGTPPLEASHWAAQQDPPEKTSPRCIVQRPTQESRCEKLDGCTFDGFVLLNY